MQYTKFKTTAAALALAVTAAFAHASDTTAAAEFVGPAPMTAVEARAALDKFFVSAEALLNCKYDAACTTKVLHFDAAQYQTEQARLAEKYGKNGEQLPAGGLRNLLQIALAATTPEQAEKAALRAGLADLFAIEMLGKKLHLRGISGTSPVAAATGAEGLFWLENTDAALDGFALYVASISDDFVAEIYEKLRAPDNGIAALGRKFVHATRTLLAQ